MAMNLVLKVRRKRMLLIVLVLFAVILGGILLDSVLIEPRWIRVNRYRFPVADLPKAFQGFTIVHLTDLHCSKYVSVGYLRKVVRKVNALSPDVIVITGDFVRGSSDPAYAEEVGNLLADLRASNGVFAVPGNHDYWSGIETVERAVSKAGIRFLTNANVTIERSGEHLVLCGVDDLWEGVVNFSDALKGTESASPRILLMHNPDSFEEAAQYPFDLILCGHTHGGQIVLPLIGPPLVPSRYGKLYAAGFFRKNGRSMYVNRGVGLVPPAVRFCCRPEIAVFALERASQTRAAAPAPVIN
jgi:predicted MPP superfamily phosphohydrolase